MFKYFLIHSWIGTICLVIGILAATAIIDQWELLGIEILSLENYQHNDYMKRGPNILKLFLFSVISIGGVGKGVMEINQALRILKNDALT